MRISALALALIALIMLGSPAQAGDSDWPGWFGPNGDLTASDGEKIYGKMPKKIWESNDLIPPGRAADGRRAASEEHMNEPGSGGFASPLYYQGNVYLFLYKPGGTAFDSISLERLNLTHEEAAAQPKDKRDTELATYGTRRWLIEADDMIVCLDGKTGKTKWIRTFPGKGLNWNLFSKGGPGLTPYAYDGKIYALGTAGAVYCVDAKTGEEVWTRDIGERAKKMEELRTISLKLKIGPRFNRDFLSSLVVADGVVVVSDHAKFKVLHPESRSFEYHYDSRNGLVGLDAKTGKRLWHVPNSANGLAIIPWVHKGKTYILGDDKEALRCIEVATGKVKWEIKPGHKGKFPAVANEDYVIFNPAKGEKDSGPAICYRITPEKAEKAWQLSEKMGQIRSNCVIKGEYAYVHSASSNLMLKIEVKTGRIVAMAKFNALNGEHDNAFLMVIGDALFTAAPRDKRGYNTFEIEGDGFKDSQKYLNIQYDIGYIVAMLPAVSGNRIFVRTADRVICYEFK